MHTTPEGTEDMNNAKAIAAATAQLVDTDQPAAARARSATAGATNQPRTRASEPETDAREHTGVDFSTAIAPLPAAVDEAMQKALPHKYTPELASQIAKDMDARLTGTKCPVYEDCTDTGAGHYDHFSRFEVVDNADASTVIDAGMVANSGSDAGAIVYLQNAEFTDTAALRAKAGQVRDLLDRVERVGDRVLGVGVNALDSIDERIKDDVDRLISLLAYRRRMAIALNPSKSAFTEPEAAQEASAAFSLATRALGAALAVTPDRAGTLMAVDGWLNVVKDEDRGLCDL